MELVIVVVVVVVVLVVMVVVVSGQILFFARFSFMIANVCYLLYLFVS